MSSSHAAVAPDTRSLGEIHSDNGARWGRKADLSSVCGGNANQTRRGTRGGHPGHKAETQTVNA